MFRGQLPVEERLNKGRPGEWTTEKRETGYRREERSLEIACCAEVIAACHVPHFAPTATLTAFVKTTMPYLKYQAYTATHQVVGRDFSENIPAVASFALAVGSSAGWLGHEASLTSKHTKSLPTS